MSADIFGGNAGFLHKVLDLRGEKHQVIASNIANADTPGYSPARMSFQEELKQAAEGSHMGMSTTDPAHIGAHGNGRFDAVTGTISRPLEDSEGIGDGNPVSVDQEMVRLSENQIRYEAAAQMLSRHFDKIKFVIRSGK
jgi:flagellar basal-body rod protein FlgB